MVDSLPKEFKDFRSFVVDGGNDDQLLNYIKEYTENRRYTGAFFHELTYAGTSHPDRFDISDVASLSLLSVTLNGRMAQELTEDSEYTKELAKELAREPDRDLAELTTDEVKRMNGEEGLGRAWGLISQIDGIGSTRTSKLLARKRPRLIPIWDQVVKNTLGLTKNHWIDFHRALTDDDGKLNETLGELAIRAGVGNRYSRLRVFDILTWMHGRKNNIEPVILTERDNECTE